MRAAGLPARLAAGLVYQDGAFYYHAWVEACAGMDNGRAVWIACDPVFGQLPADATHIRLVTGGLDRQADLVRVLGRLELEVLGSG
jgi:transglutaminase-like putative cysteine protease